VVGVFFHQLHELNTNFIQTWVSMKYLLYGFIIITAFAFVSYTSETKSDNCKAIHKGAFYFYPKSSNKKYRIIRDGKIQKEITLSNNDTAIYKINWIDDCTYTLEHISGGAKIPEGMKRPKIYTQFTTVTSNYYLFKACMDSLNSKYCLNDTIWVKPK
jgi:hypothetical protein